MRCPLDRAPANLQPAAQDPAERMCLWSAGRAAAGSAGRRASPGEAPAAAHALGGSRGTPLPPLRRRRGGDLQWQVGDQHPDPPERLRGDQGTKNPVPRFSAALFGNFTSLYPLPALTVPRTLFICI